MRSTISLAASALVAMASAQTFTDCNPMNKTCPNDPAMPATFETNFKTQKSAATGWKITAGSLNYGADGAEFTVAKKGDAPTIQSEGYLHFGYIEVKMKAAAGAGIVSSIVIQSDDLDEIDWEFIGSVSNKAQMNYFGKGNTTTFDRMIEADVTNAQEMNTYALNWTSEALTWIINDKPMRTLKFSDANGGRTYPQTPSNVRIGIWAGGDSPDQGTRDWAGGAPDYSKAPFTQTVESIKVTNYSPGKEYQWTDKSGTFQSIKVIDSGNKAGADVNTIPIAAATGASSSNGTYVALASGVAPSNGTAAADSACDCGTATVTVTGNPPSSTAVTATKPATTAPATTTGGIKTDTRPPPTMSSTSGVARPTGGASSSNGTGNSTTPPQVFTGTGSSNAVAALLFGVVGAVAVFGL